MSIHSLLGVVVVVAWQLTQTQRSESSSSDVPHCNLVGEIEIEHLAFIGRALRK